MITGINEPKTLTLIYHVNVNVNLIRKCNLNQWWNKYKCWCEFKKHICENDYVWNPSIYVGKNGKYLVSNMDDSMIMWHEVI